MLPADWSSSQLTEFLASVSRLRDEPSAMRLAVEHAAEALEAEVGAIVRDGKIVAAVGFPDGEVSGRELLSLAAGCGNELAILGIGRCCAVMVPFEEGVGGMLIVARAGDEPVAPEERNLLRGLTRVLTMALEMLERQKLLERLSRIQRSISHRAPLQEVLDAITAGGAELLGAEVALLRLIDPELPDELVLASASGVSPDLAESTKRIPLTQGAAGRAVVQNRLAIVEDYQSAGDRIPAFAADQVKIAMAAPVHENGRVVGCLTVASHRTARLYSDSEQEALLALAEHASLALTDAKTVEAMREAQRTRDLFLAMVSHELKTPLTVIMGTLRTLEMQRGSLPEPLVAELLVAAFARGRDLERLIDRLLTGARAQLATTEQVALLPDLVDRAVRGFEAFNVVVEPPPALHFLVRGDAVTEILGILLENAVNHSSIGSRIRVRAEVGQDHALISISNPGLLPEGLDHQWLFEPFRRGPEARSPGVGLGLYIARRAAESIGGEILASSEEGRVRFTLRFPVKWIEEPSNARSPVGVGTSAR
jgi:signal transduction histidine kinase